MPGTRGRSGGRPKPDHLKAVQGTARRNRTKPTRPESELGLPEPPQELTTDALAEWNRVAPELAQRGVLSETDRATLAAYCQSFGRWLEAERLISAEGAYYTITTKAGERIIRKHPAVLVADQERKHNAGLRGSLRLVACE